MPDRIAPPAARQPADVVGLVSMAMSDGDLEAALAQYDHGALLTPWAGQPAEPGITTRCHLDQLMDLRLPLSVSVQQVLEIGDLALLLVRREITGLSADGEHVTLAGCGATVVHRVPEGLWLIVADAWQLRDVHDVVF
jgi:ketosteroid isomerase-like protein